MGLNRESLGGKARTELQALSLAPAALRATASKRGSNPWRMAAEGNQMSSQTGSHGEFDKAEQLRSEWLVQRS